MITQAQAIEKMAETLFDLHMEVQIARHPKAPLLTWKDIRLEPIRKIWRDIAEQELRRVVALEELPTSVPE